MSGPDISVVVPSHDRPVRLAWLLNALEEQTLDRARWEVIVGHDSAGDATTGVLESHPLAAAGLLREVRLAPGSAPPGANRNAALGLARAPLVAFTDDDCRPPDRWLELALAAAERSPGAIVQGRVVPDPDEQHLLRAPHRHTRMVDPPTPYGEACNIVYPRAVLDRHAGFDASLYTGEDTDLLVRARRDGTPYVGAEEAVTYHAVVPLSLPRFLLSLARWQNLPQLIGRHPELRRSFPLRMFWKRTHVALPLALAGVLLGRRHPLLWACLLPWAIETAPGYGRGARGRVRSALELPSRLAVDLTEFGVLAYGSARARTLFL